MAIKWYRECEYTATCERCSRTESIYDSDGEYDVMKGPSAYFRKQGWSDKSGKTLCPHCAKEWEDSNG